MRIVTVASLAGLALISLSACNRNSQSASGAAPASAPAASSGSSMGSDIASGQMPHYREGVWETTMVSDRTEAPMVSKMCLDKTVEDKMAGFGASFDKSKCASYNVNHQLNGDWTVQAVCDRGEMGKVSTTGTIHGDFNSAYHMVSDSTTTGATMDRMNGEHKITIDGKYLGPCADAGMKPGDVEVNGMKMNMINPTAPMKAPS